jgi:hypothetical protein
VIRAVPTFCAAGASNRLYGNPASRCPTRRSQPCANAWLRARDDRDARARHWREHGDLLGGQRHHPETAPVSAARPADLHLESVPADGLQSVLDLAAGVSGVPGADTCVCVRRGVHERSGEPHRARSPPARDFRAGFGRALQGARRQRDVWAYVRRRRNAAQRSAGHHPVLRAVDVGVWRQPERDRVAGGGEWHTAHGHRRHAAVVRRRRSAYRGLESARHQPSQPAESRQSLSLFNRAARERRDATDCEGGARHAPGRMADVDRATRRPDARRAHAGHEKPSPAARSAADADRRRRADGGPGSAGRRRLCPADCLRQPREPVACARRVAPQGVRRARRARRGTLAPAAAIHGGRLCAVVRRRRTRPRRRRRWRARADRLLSGQPPTIRRPVARPRRARVHADHRPGDRRGPRSRAAAAPGTRRDLDGAEGGRHAQLGGRGAQSRPPRSPSSSAPGCCCEP